MARILHGRRVTVTVAVVSTLVIAATVQGSVANADSSVTAATVAGSFQHEIGSCADWTPACTDANLALGADGWWRGTFTLSAGSYQYKVALNNTWDVSYGDNGGSGNINLVVPADGTQVTFVFDPVSHQVADSLGEVSAVGSVPEPIGVCIAVAAVLPELAA